MATDEQTFTTVHRTASFKLHNPSQRKREIIEYSFTHYTDAYRQLLEWAQANRPTLDEQIVSVNEQGRLRWANDKRVAGYLAQAGIKPPVHSSLSDALYRDVAGNLLSYYRLHYDYLQQFERYEEAKAEHEAQHPDKPFKRRAPSPPSFPISRDPHPSAFAEALDRIAATADVDDEEWLYRQVQLVRLQRGRFMPMYFSRPDGVPNNRNFSLLVDEERGKYFGLLFLLPQGHEWGQPIPSFGNLKRMGKPSTADEAFEPPTFNSRTRSAILCPLEMGKWHVDDFLTHPYANVRSAFLIERDGEYFLNVTFEFTVPAIDPQTVIGVDRGIAQFIAVRVLDFAGNIIHSELWSGDEFMELQWDIKKTLKRLQKRGKDVTGLRKISRISDHTVHALANRIADLAEQYKAQVVLENLRYLDRQKERFTKLRATPYQKIAAALNYKLPMRGLPEPELVGPAYTSRMCAQCTYGAKENRPDQATFHCQECGHEDHADLNAATNIALRWLARLEDRDWWPKNVESKRR